MTSGTPQPDMDNSLIPFDILPKFEKQAEAPLTSAYEHTVSY